MNIRELINKTNDRRVRDAQRFADHDGDLCMLCGAYGPDKRSLFLACLYDVTEAVSEAIDLYACPKGVRNRGFYLRICKSCRAGFLEHLMLWRAERIALRNIPLHSDGEPLMEDLLEDSWADALP